MLAMCVLRPTNRYHCFPVAASDKDNTNEIEKGDKILLPASALDSVCRLSHFLCLRVCLVPACLLLNLGIT